MLSDLTTDKAVDAAVKECERMPLPFIVPDPQDPNRCLSMWMVSETGDYQADMILGLTYAEDLLQRAKELSNQMGVPSIAQGALETVLCEMVCKGNAGPIERGFIWRIARAAMAGSVN